MSRCGKLWPIAIVVSSLLALSPRLAAADSRCPVRIAEGAHSQAWEDAVKEVGRVLADRSQNAGDCRDVVVSPDRRGALVVFSTHDGRVAERRIEGAGELRPLVEALLVTIPLDTSRAAPAAPPDRQAASSELPEAPRVSGPRSALLPLPPPLTTGVARPAPSPPSTGFSFVLPRQLEGLPDRDETPRAKGRDGAEVLLGLGAGVRGGWPGADVAPVGQLMAGFALARWEFGVLGRWEVEHDVGTESAAGHVHASAVGGGAVVGRRERVGPVLVVVGTSLTVFAAAEEYGRHGTDVASKVFLSDAFAEPRAGFYLGCVFPRTARFRLRAQLDAEVAMTQHVPSSTELPILPRWSAGLTIGAETAFLP